MATDSNITPTPAQQPDLRAFIVYDRVPEGMRAYPVTEDVNEPMLRLGEFVIVDPADCDPEHNEFFVVQWKSGKSGPSVQLTTWMERKQCWAVGGSAPAFVAERVGASMIPRINITDYGYRTDYMQEVIVGRVIGILESSAAEPRRLKLT